MTRTQAYKNGYQHREWLCGRPAVPYCFRSAALREAWEAGWDAAHAELGSSLEYQRA